MNDAITELHFVCDGPPSHESGRFVELEDQGGRSVGVGEWRDRGNGLHALVVRPSAFTAFGAMTKALREIAAIPDGVAVGRARMLALQALEEAEYVTADWVRGAFDDATHAFLVPGDHEAFESERDRITRRVLTAIANGQENAAELASAVTESMAALDA